MDYDADLERKCHDTGAEKLIIKPIMPKDLIARIGKYFNNGPHPPPTE